MSINVPKVIRRIDLLERSGVVLLFLVGVVSCQSIVRCIIECSSVLLQPRVMVDVSFQGHAVGVVSCQSIAMTIIECSSSMMQPRGRVVTCRSRVMLLVSCRVSPLP